ncbi:MAG: hypothetical protein MZU79_05145 [Anaerotruncus sp.]|nr:hypothetical protein [Anaerotruncus sp.]
MPCLLVFPPSPFPRLSIYAGVDRRLDFPGERSVKLCAFWSPETSDFWKTTWNASFSGPIPRPSGGKAFPGAGGLGVPGQRFGLGGVRDIPRHGKRRGGAAEAPRHDGGPSRGDLAAGGLLGPARCWGVAKR